MRILYGSKDITESLLSYERNTGFTGDTLIGNTTCAQVTIEIDNSEKVLPSSIDQVITIYNGSTKIGTYRTYEQPETVNYSLKLTLYDDMVKLNKRYLTKMSYPCKVSDQIVEIAKLAGVTIIYNNLPSSLLNKMINWYDNTINMRLYIGWIAEAAGMNAYADQDGNIRFYELSKTIKANIPSDNIEDYTVCNQVNIQRVEYNNGLVIFERGEDVNDTLYISSDNPYIDNQAMIDHIYDLYKGVTFESAKGIKIIELPGLLPGSLISYGNHKWIALSIKTIYHGGTYSVQTIDGEISTKEYQALSQQIGDSTKIRMLTIEVNRNSNEVKILAQEQEDLNKAYAQLVINTDSIKQEVMKSSESVYLMETGKGNIFDNCNQYVRKNETETGIKYIADMPLGIDMQELKNRDICMSVDIKTLSAIPKSLNNRLGCKFIVTYDDNTQDTFALWFTIGMYYLAVIRGQRTVNIDKRIYRTYHVQDKKIKYVSNLGVYAEVNGNYIAVGRPKVEYGKVPTGFQFDLQTMRDNIATVEKNYTSIDQQVGVLTLQAVSSTEQITTIKGNVTSLTTRLEKAELQLTPQQILAKVESVLGYGIKEQFQKTELSLTPAKILAKVESQLGYGIDKKFESAEQKITPTAIVNAVNSRISDGGKLTTTSTTLDKDGFHVKGKGFDLTNNANKKVFTLDANGNVVMNDATANNITANNAKLSGEFTNVVGTKKMKLSEVELAFFQKDSQQREIKTVTINNERMDINSISGLPVASIYGYNNLMCLSNGVGLIGLIGTIYLGNSTSRPSISTEGSNVKITGRGATGGLQVYNESTLDFSVNHGFCVLNGFMHIKEDLVIDGSLSVKDTGYKRKVMRTSHGSVGMEALETPTPMFEDNGSGVIGVGGELKIFFDQNWLEVTDTSQEYFVYIQICNDGKAWIKERNREYFIVEGTPGIHFMWCVKARQKGFEIERYNKVEVSDDELEAMNMHDQIVAPIFDKQSNMKNQYQCQYDQILKERISEI